MTYDKESSKTLVTSALSNFILSFARTWYQQSSEPIVARCTQRIRYVEWSVTSELASPNEPQKPGIKH